MKLGAKLALGAIVPIAFSAAVQAWNSGVAQRQASFQAVEHKTRAMGSMLAPFVGPDLAFGDTAAAKEKLAALQTDPEVKFAMLTDSKGATVAERGTAAPALLASARRPPEAPIDTHTQDGLLMASFPIAMGNKPLGRVTLGVSLASAEAAATASVRNVIGVALFSVICFGLASYLAARRIVRRLQLTADLLKEISEGDGDLTRRLTPTGDDEITDLALSFNLFVEKIHSVVDGVRTSALKLTHAAGQVSTSATSISEGSQRQAAALESSAADLGQLTSTVKLNANNARQAAVLAAASRTVAEQGGSVVSSAVDAMNKISRSSAQISEIISVIDEISFQTNVLALNAAVEAARAGDHGRGFAVVASEVGNLSQRSAAAARQIKTLIQDSALVVSGGAQLVNQSGQSLQEILGSVNRVTTIVADIAGASQEQSSSVEALSQTVGQIDGVTQSSVAETERLAGTAEGLAQQARILLQNVQRFKLDAHDEEEETSDQELPAFSAPPRGGRLARSGGRVLKKAAGIRGVAKPRSKATSI